MRDAFAQVRPNYFEKKIEQRSSISSDCVEGIFSSPMKDDPADKNYSPRGSEHESGDDEDGATNERYTVKTNFF